MKIYFISKHNDVTSCRTTKSMPVQQALSCISSLGWKMDHPSGDVEIKYIQLMPENEAEREELYK